ncbi:MAG: FtsW/RodA/SpoVE family cell cycle protein [Micrococcales bacterium]|nr:FtsW/RodA/SpoVE family cell cycle protein [Micrococcales bacterium]
MENRRALITAYYMILFSVAALVGLGLVMTVSAQTVTALANDMSPYLQGLYQAVYAAIGVGAGLAFAHLPPPWLRRVGWAAMIVTLVLLGLVLLIGEMRGGNQNWLTIGGRTVQPAEFVKLALALWLGSVLAMKAPTLGSWVDLIVPVLVVVALTLGLVLAGGDAGTAAVIGILVLGALILAGVPWSKLATVILVMGSLAVPVVMLSSHRRARFATMLDPGACTEAERLGQCWQVSQAKYSLAQGGLLGQGLGASRAKWYLSQAESDFVFAIIGEELGWLGAVTVLVLFGLLGVGLFRVVRLHPDRFAQITIGTVGCWIMGQALVNVGMVVQVLPVIGVPLPFVSVGGSSLVSCLAAIGVVVGLMRGNREVAHAIAPKSRRALATAGVAAVSGPTVPSRSGPKRVKA